MKVLHVFDHSIPLHSGYTFRSLHILREQHKLGIDTLHVTGRKHLDPKGEIETVDGLDFFRTTVAPGWIEKLPAGDQISVITTLRQRIEDILLHEKVDIIHAHSPALNGMAAVMAAKAFGIPVLYEVRAFWEDAAVSHGTAKEGGLRYKLTRWLESYVLKKADAVTCICEGLRQDIIDRGIPAEKITVIPNAVDISKFSGPHDADPDLQTKLGLAGQKVIGFIGSFYDYEGLDILMASMPLVIQRMPDTKLLMVGGGPQEEALRAQVSTLGLNDHVIFTGRVPHTEVQLYYNLVDVFAYPRKKIRLTDLVTPLKPLEAMAQHKLVAASDIGGHNELIENGVNGVLFKADNPQSLADTLVDLLGRPESWPAFHQAGRHYVENVRNWENSVSRYPAIYEKLKSHKK
ncbi:MAG: glycosyltransferase, exosortase A system-associated [Kordiimonas sp.]|nr:glycosyltransferase, exosortase A system-associated [Kordiimonas sp.]|tara:strand:+ start:1052 stop:2263 length:1212 start_codon:yes stop_codon:yes gene_type:complete